VGPVQSPTRTENKKGKDEPRGLGVRKGNQKRKKKGKKKSPICVFFDTVQNQQ